MMSEKLRPNPKFPKTLKDLKLPTLSEVEVAVRQGEQMVVELAKKRRGKLLRTDPEMDTTKITI